MAKKTIWYCHPYAGAPSIGMSFRPYYLTKEFNIQGYNAYVIGSSFHHLLKKKINQKSSIELQNIEGVPFVNIKVNRYVGNGVGRFINMISYAIAFKFYIKKIIEFTGMPDVIIVSSVHPFHYYALKKFAKKNKAQLVFEVRDLWPLSLIELLNLKCWHPLVKYLSKLEKIAYSQSDYVVSLLPDAYLYMKNKGLSYSRFVYIPNGINLDQTSTDLPENIERILVNLKQKHKFLIGYAGAFGIPNALNLLIDALSIIEKKNLTIHCILIGEGILKKKLISQANQLGLSNITFLDPVSKQAVSKFFNFMDVLYLGWLDSQNLYKYGVSPNKLFDYMLSGIPIIESGGASNSLILKKKCGLQCNVDPLDIANTIISIKQISPKKRTIMGLNGKKAVIQEHNYEILAQKYMKLFD